MPVPPAGHRAHDIRGNPSALLGSVVGRIDRLKDELVSHDDYAAWAGTLGPDADREREFAAIYAAHDRMLEESGTLDFGDLLLNAFRLLRSEPRVRARVTARYRHLLVDELQDANFAQGLLMRLLAGEHGQISAADLNSAREQLRVKGFGMTAAGLPTPALADEILGVKTEGAR